MRETMYVTGSPDRRSSEDVYWAADPDPEVLAGGIMKRISDVGAAIQHSSLVDQAYRMFHGAMALAGQNGQSPSSAFVGREGEQGEIVTLRVNHIRSNALARHNLVTNPELAWTCQAVNTDAQSLADAEAGSEILEYLWKNQDYGRLAIDAVLGAILFGEEFLVTLWDDTAGAAIAHDRQVGRTFYQGDVVCHPVRSEDVFRDPSAVSFDRSPWLCVRIPASRWDLVARYPGRKDDILGHTKATDRSEDLVDVLHFFHRKTAALPEGRHAILLGPGCVLHDSSLEDCYEPLPVHRMAAGDLRGTPYAYTDFWEAMAVQELEDDYQSSLATNIVAFGKQLISAEEGTNLDVDQVGNGPSVLYRPRGTQPPVPVQLTACPSDAWRHLDLLRTAGRQLMGLNDIVMGQPQTSELNGSAFALLLSTALQANSDLQRRYTRFVASVGRSVLAIFRDNASGPRILGIVGEHGPMAARCMSLDPLKLRQVRDVYVEIADPISQTAAGRMQLAQLFSSAGFVQVPEQLQQVVESGRLEPLTQGLRDELLYVAEENEQLLRGQEPGVLITDSHRLHVREHRATSFSPAVRNNPAALEALNRHVTRHMDFLMNTDPRILDALGQAAPPMPGPGPAPAAPDMAMGPLPGQLPPVPKVPAPPPDPASGAPFPFAPKG